MYFLFRFARRVEVFFFKISVTYYGAVPHIVFQHKDF